jgi:hypothetical protein
VAQVRYASRLPRIPARQDHLEWILLPIHAAGREKFDQNNGIHKKIICRKMKMTLPSTPEIPLWREQPSLYRGYVGTAAPAVRRAQATVLALKVKQALESALDRSLSPPLAWDNH